MSRSSDNDRAPQVAEPAGRGGWWRRLGGHLPVRDAAVRVELAPRRVTASRRRAGRDAKEERFAMDCPAGAAGAPAWQTPLAAVAQLLAVPEWRGARTELVLSNHFVRYALVPWRDDLGSEAERRAFVRHCFTRIYGAPAEAWELRLSASRYGAPAIASAVEPALLEALRTVARAASLRLVSIDPLLSAAFNLVRAQISEDRCGFVVAEPGRACVARIEGGAWRSIRCQRLDEDWPHDLPRLLARERLLAQADAADEPLYLYAPQLTGSDLLTGSWTPAGLRMPSATGLVVPAATPVGVAALEQPS